MMYFKFLQLWQLNLVKKTICQLNLVKKTNIVSPYWFATIGTCLVKLIIR